MTDEDKDKNPHATESPTDEQPPEASDTSANAQSDELDEDAKTDRAVEEIVEREGDDLLAQQDEEVAEAAMAADRKHGLLYRWWHSRKARWLTLLVFFGALAAVAAIPTTRYWCMNMAGVRVGASFSITDSLTGTPLKNVVVTIDEVSGKTDANGKAKLTGLKLGPHHFKLERTGFAAFEDDTTLGWGSNPLGNFTLKAIGLQYSFTVKDALTSLPLQGAEVSSGEAVGISDKNGKAVLTLASTNTKDLEVTIARQDYRTSKVVVKADTTTPTEVRLLTDRRAVFIVHENGLYNLYTSDLDGQNRKLVLNGTGNETANIALAVSPSGDHVAMVATRDNQRNADGFLLTTLTLIDLSDSSTLTLAHAEQIQLVDWIGSRLIFEQVGADASSATNRYSVIGYDFASNSRVQLASGKRLTTVLSARGAIYYGLADDTSDPSLQPGMYRINPDASNKQLILDKEPWTTYRVNYTTLDVQTADGWYSVSLTNGATAQIVGPSVYASRLYDDNDDTTKSLWIDTANGNLTLYTVNDAKETIVRSQAGLTYPVRWLTADTAVYRVVTGSETADYAVSLLGGGQPIKIGDVVNTYGFTQGQ